MSEAGSGDPEQGTGSRYGGHRPPEPAGAGLPRPALREAPRAAAVIPIHPQPGPGSHGLNSHAPAGGPAPQPHNAQAGPVTFNQGELRLIFGLYGRKVAAGEWRDYAMDFLRDQAVFSVYRRSSEVPLYRIEKNPRLARKQGEYAAIAASGLILKRGPDLARVLAVLDKPLKIVR